MSKTTCFFQLSFVIALLLFLQCSEKQRPVDGVTLDASKRYFQNAKGDPLFLLGYYRWPAMDTSRVQVGAGKYTTLLDKAAEYNLNYLRVSLGINRDPCAGNPVPYLYKDGKYDLNQWDDSFWTGLKKMCQYSKGRGVYLHIAFFDGVDIRKGNKWFRWVNSFWNIDNQTEDFYGDLDTNGDSNTNVAGEFYNTDDFINKLGVGKYQAKLIEKTISETSAFDNVFYEVGNEVWGAPDEWNEAIIQFVKSLTPRAITQSYQTEAEGGNAPNTEGRISHEGDTPLEVKKIIAKDVGKGYCTGVDPDGSDLQKGNPDDLRKAAWITFTNGGAIWGGFSLENFNTASGNPEAWKYFQYLADFISNLKIPFWEMRPNSYLVSNSEENSCFSKNGSYYLVYIPEDDSVKVKLSATQKPWNCIAYNATTGEFTQKNAVEGTQTFSKPAGAYDWALYIFKQAATEKK